jgi:hypothetical protein
MHAAMTTAQMPYRTGKWAAFFHADSKQNLTRNWPAGRAIRRTLGPTAAVLLAQQWRLTSHGEPAKFKGKQAVNDD